MTVRSITVAVAACALCAGQMWAQQNPPAQPPTQPPAQPVQPQTQPAQPPATGVPADAGSSTTAKGTTTADRDTSQKIQQSLADDKTLSSSSRGVKVTAKNGRVTLRGKVASEEDKKAIEQKAEEVAGAGNVTDDLAVKTTKTHK